MSPESTTLYYEHITRTYTAQFGDYGYPEILIYSVNFQKFVDWQRNGQWREAAEEMASALERLRLAGADFGLIATNTMHFVFDQVQKAVHMPLLSIVDATVEAIVAAGLRSVGLLGTKFTMRERFFLGGLERSGIAAIVPETGVLGKRRIHARPNRALGIRHVAALADSLEDCLATLFGESAAAEALRMSGGRTQQTQRQGGAKNTTDIYRLHHPLRIFLKLPRHADASA